MTVYISKDPKSTELTHYGVKGMKWGIRRDPTGTVEKVNSQASKWDAKRKEYLNKRKDYINRKTNDYLNAVKYTRKADRLKSKAAKLDMKAGKQKTRLIRSTNWNKVYRYEGKAENLRYKASKAMEKATGIDEKSNKMLYKAQHYQHKTNRLLKQTSIALNKVDKKKAAKGKYLLRQSINKYYRTK